MHLEDMLRITLLWLMLLCGSYGFQTIPSRQHAVRHHRSAAALISTVPIRQQKETNLYSSVATSAVEAVTTVAVKTTSHSSFWPLLFSFVLGGLFFSSAFALVAAVYSFGRENVIRLVSLLLTVVKQVLVEVKEILKTAVTILRTGEASGDMLIKGMTRWASAWQFIKDGWKRTKQSAAKGAQAIKLEARFVAGAVGQPGLSLIQYGLDRLTPLTLAGIAEEAFTEACNDFRDTRIKRIRLENFDMGRKAPLLQQARFYNVGDDDLAMDVQVKWESEMTADVSVTGKTLGVNIPVSVRNLRFEGPVRVIVTSLRKRAPGYGALLVSLPEPPKIGLDIKVLGAALKSVPWLKSQLIDNLREAIGKEALWPRRLVVPAMAVPKRKASPVLSSAELEKLRKDDPVLKAERSLRRRFDSNVTQFVTGEARLKDMELIVVDEDLVNGTNETMAVDEQQSEQDASTPRTLKEKLRWKSRKIVKS